MTDRTPEEMAKRKARQRVNSEVKAGRMQRPNDLPCVDCGHLFETDGKRHEYDHHLGYEPEHWLDVVARCAKCHHQKDSPKAQQTHCVNGHEFNAENTYLKSNGSRWCKACGRERDRRRKRPEGYWKRVNAARKDRNYGKRSGT